MPDNPKIIPPVSKKPPVDLTKDTGAKSLPRRERKHFSSISRELQANDLESKGVQKMLLNHIDRVEEQLHDLMECRSKLAVAERDKAVLEQRLKVSVSADVIFGLCLTIGSILLGITPNLWSTPPYGYIILAAGISMILGGIISRWLMR